MLHMLVICFYLLLLPATSGSYPKCREGEKEGFFCIIVGFLFVEMLYRGRSACLRWIVKWKAAKREAPSVAAFLNPGLLLLRFSNPGLSMLSGWD